MVLKLDDVKMDDGAFYIVCFFKVRIEQFMVAHNLWIIDCNSTL